MKCERCGGLIVSEPGICGQPDHLKCINCGREPKEPGDTLQKGDNEMEEKMKTCTKCNKELLATSEYFSKNKARPDGLEAWCKLCKKKAQADYRVKKAEGESRHPVKKILKSKLRVLDQKTNSVPITHGSPEAIMKALKMGIIVEMIQKIGVEYGLKVTVESA